MTSPSC